MKKLFFSLCFSLIFFFSFADVADEPAPYIEGGKGFGFYAIILAVLAGLSFVALYFWRKRKK